jgi:hypothetical protein
MKYLLPKFTLPCSDHVSQEEWDRIFAVGERGLANKRETIKETCKALDPIFIKNFG